MFELLIDNIFAMFGGRGFQWRVAANKEATEPRVPLG